ncbi:MAG: hypothetical protein GTO14_06825 [Anaerolineales bacterium]|nr:hypothetical protein [Anaerolineales bacterium]
MMRPLPPLSEVKRFRLRIALAIVGVLIVLCSSIWLVSLNRPNPRQQLRLTPAPIVLPETIP